MTAHSIDILSELKIHSDVYLPIGQKREIKQKTEHTNRDTDRYRTTPN